MKLSSSGRAYAAAFAGLAGLAGCQAIFGLGDYTQQPVGHGGAGGSITIGGDTVGAGGLITTGGGFGGDIITAAGGGNPIGGGSVGGSGVGGAAPTNCESKQPTQEVVGSSATFNLCSATPIPGTSATGSYELHPTAACNGGVCVLYWQRVDVATGDDQILCAVCDEEPFDCSASMPVVVSPASQGFINPYRTLSTLWAVDPSKVDGGSAGHLVYASPLGASCPATPPSFVHITPIDAMTNNGDVGAQFYPAASPDDSTVVFARYGSSMSAPFQLWKMAGSLAGGYGTPTVLPGFDTLGLEYDFRAQPLWQADGTFTEMLFSSTRWSATPDSVNEADVGLATLDMGTNKFTAVQVPQLATSDVDFAPFRIEKDHYLWSNTQQLFELDANCQPNFGVPDFTTHPDVNAPGTDNAAAQIDDQGNIDFARTASSVSQLYRASGGTAIIPVVGAPASNDTDPAPVPGTTGAIVFASDRAGGNLVLYYSDGSTPPVRVYPSDDGIQRTPFVDYKQRLWFAWENPAIDASATVLAVANPMGPGQWAPPQPITGFPHTVNADDDAPRPNADATVIFFASQRPGGLGINGPTIWAATRPNAMGTSWTMVALPELGTVLGADTPFITGDGDCRLMVSGQTRDTNFDVSVGDTAQN